MSAQDPVKSGFANTATKPKYPGGIPCNINLVVPVKKNISIKLVMVTMIFRQSQYW